MSKIATFSRSSVGRKVLMALTGVFLCSFLVVHLSINLFLFKSDQGGTFDVYSEFMATYPFVRPLEILLFAGFLLHAILGVILWWENRRVRGTRYAVNAASRNSDLSSRIMWITAAVVLAFLVVHINTFFVQSRFFASGQTMFEMVAEAFADPWYDAFYLVALVFLGYHLRHGFQSSFQSLGLRHPRSQMLIEVVAVLFWLLIPLAFAAMPLYFLWAHLTGAN